MGFFFFLYIQSTKCFLGKFFFILCQYVKSEVESVFTIWFLFKFIWIHMKSQIQCFWCWQELRFSRMFQTGFSPPRSSRPMRGQAAAADQSQASSPYRREDWDISSNWGEGPSYGLRANKGELWSQGESKCWQEEQGRKWPRLKKLNVGNSWKD